MLFVVLVRLYVIEHRPLAENRFSKLVVLLLGLTFLEALNPRGGGLKAAVSLLLFAAVPLLWFFVGRNLLHDER